MADTFTQTWKAERLSAAPMIAPARQYTWPLQIAGEEDALARGAMLVTVRPREGASYLLTCALGFTSPTVPSGIFACPHPDHLCAVAGGYAYMADTLNPQQCTLLAMKPVVAVHAAVQAGLLLFVGFHDVLAWSREGLAWRTSRLSWEGVRLDDVTETHANGTGWDMHTDRDAPFRIDLATGEHTGGGFRSR